MNRIAFLTVAASAALVGGCKPESGEEHCRTEEPGIICTIAGNGENGYDRKADSDALPALEAKFSLPQDTLTASDGTVYLLDWNNHRIRSYDPEERTVSWVAGRGELGGDLDDPANGDFNHPTNIIFDPTEDNIIVAAWHNSKIRSISRDSGAVSDTCGDGKRAYFGDAGPAMTASLDLPASLAYDPQGNLIVMDQANQVLRSINPAGEINLVAGRCIVDAAAPAGPGPCAEGVEPTQCPAAMDTGLPSGKFTCGDPMMFCSKPCTPSYGGDDGPATAMRMSQPFGQSATPAGRIVFDEAGNLYFADTGNHLIRMIDPAGNVHRIAGLPPMMGMKQNGYSGDGGPAIEAKINYPVDLALGEDGTLYFSDVLNHCIRAVDPSGNISTIAGVCGEQGFEGDGGAPEDAKFNKPFGIEYAEGRLNIADTGNSVIRSVLLP